MADQKKDPKFTTDEKTSFTVDSESTSADMPSITKLLNRRSLSSQSLKRAAPPPAPPSPPPMSSEAYAPASPESSALQALEPPPVSARTETPTSVVLTPPDAPPAADAPVIESQVSSVAAPASVNTDGQLSISIESQDSGGFELESGRRPNDDAPKAEAPVVVSAPVITESATGGMHEISLAGSDGLTQPISTIDAASALKSAIPETPTGAGFTLEPAVEPSANPSMEPAPAASPLSFTPPPSVSTEGPKVQTAARRADRRPKTPILVWELAKLKKGGDPMGRGLAMLFDRGATSALFLSITPAPKGSPVPHFIATASLEATAGKTAIWSGLRWDPTVVPELWNYFVKSGVVELSPPGTKTNVASIRNVVRGAFGVDQTEYLTLLRAGPPTACRGVVAVVSTSNLLDVIREPLAHITSLPSKLAKKSAA